jgi:hypothetical protein
MRRVRERLCVAMLFQFSCPFYCHWKEFIEVEVEDVVQIITETNIWKEDNIFFNFKRFYIDSRFAMPGNKNSVKWELKATLYSMQPF